MAAAHHSLETTLRSCFPDAWLRETARAHGAVTRQRKVDIARFFWSLVLGFSAGRERTLTQLHRAFELGSGVALSRSGFYERFTPNLVVFLKAAVLHAVSIMAEPSENLGGKLAGFRDLIVADSSVIRLRDALQKWFPACRTNSTQAAMKLHFVISVAGVSPKSLQVRGQRVHDSKLLRVGPWVSGRLLLFDLGYFGYRLFSRIDRNGGYFISRLKSSANPRIVSSNLTHRGRSRTIEGKRLQDVLPSLKRKTLDATIEVEVKHRAYREVQRTVTKQLRLVAIYNADARRYHTYVTNIPPTDLPATDIGAIYRARWQVELIFKQLKSHYRIDDLPSSNPCIVEALVYASILTLIVSRRMFQAVRALGKHPSHRTPPSRWASVFSTVAQLLLCFAPERSKRFTIPDVIDLLLRHATDPNASRRLTMRELTC